MVKMTPLDEGRIRQGLSKYQNPDITKKHVVSVLNLYKGLVFEIEPFIFNDGSRKELLNLQGTIPVVYKGTCYNIPICIWLMDTHPNNAPMCYVKPTADMQIKVSMFVDHNGKIYLPYLHDWVPLGINLRFMPSQDQKCNRVLHHILVVEMYRIPVSRHIHQVLNTLAAATRIHHIRLQHLEDSHIQVLMVLMLEPLRAIRHKDTMAHIHLIHQLHNRYHNCDHLS